MDFVVVGFYVIGFILVLVEVFVPGGLFAVAGVLCILAGVYFQEDDLTTALWKMALVVLVLAVLIPVGLKVARKTEVFRRLTREDVLTDEAGFRSRAAELEAYVGEKGTALTDLRPAGTVELDNGKRIDVTTRGDYIEKGSLVQIIAIDGTWLFAQKI